MKYFATLKDLELSSMRYINSEFNRFILIGALNALVTYLIYILYLFFLPYTISYTFAYVSGIFISYYLNTRFTFKSEIRLFKALKYPVVYLVQYCLGIFLLYVLVEIFLIDKFLAPIIVVVLTIPVTFVLSRLIIKSRSE